MTQDERWQLHYSEIVKYIVKYQRNPSRHRLEDHRMLNWLKAQRKALNKGTLSAERQKQFDQLLVLIDKYRRLNQYV